MLYRVTRERGNADILILEINSDIMDCDGAFISDGNAAHHRTNFYPADKKALGKLKDSTFKKIYWAEEDDSKREIMAEILIPSCVEADKITGIFVASPTIQNEMLGSAGKIPVIVQPFMFFMPEYRRRLSEKPKHNPCKRRYVLFNRANPHRQRQHRRHNGQRAGFTGKISVPGCLC